MSNTVKPFKMTFHSRLSHESQKYSLPVMQYKKLMF